MATNEEMNPKGTSNEDPGLIPSYKDVEVPSGHMSVEQRDELGKVVYGSLLGQVWPAKQEIPTAPEPKDLPIVDGKAQGVIVDNVTNTVGAPDKPQKA